MAVRTIELGNNAYMFESPVAGTTEVFVMAHGGCISRSQKFNVPDALTVTFFAASGEAVYDSAGDGPLHFIDAQIAEKRAGRIIGYAETSSYFHAHNFSGPGLCTDYILGKAFGKHWKFPESQASYNDARACMDTRHTLSGTGWLPHIVSVRSRSALGMHENMWLSTLIHLIRAQKPETTRIYCANCRVDKTGTWNKWLLGRTAGKATKLDSRKRT